LVAVGRGLGLPEAGKVPREALERLALLVGERGGAGLLESRELAVLALDRGERVLERALERACDEAVLGLAGVELPAGAV